jgi:putative MFS transporter
LSYSFHAFQAELYPTRIRSRAIGFTVPLRRRAPFICRFDVA